MTVPWLRSVRRQPTVDRAPNLPDAPARLQWRTPHTTEHSGTRTVEKRSSWAIRLGTRLCCAIDAGSGAPDTCQIVDSRRVSSYRLGRYTITVPVWYTKQDWPATLSGSYTSADLSRLPAPIPAYQPVSAWNYSTPADLSRLLAPIPAHQPVSAWNSSTPADLSRLPAPIPAYHPVSVWNYSTPADLSRLPAPIPAYQPVTAWNYSTPADLSRLLAPIPAHQPVSAWNYSTPADLSRLSAPIPAVTARRLCLLHPQRLRQELLQLSMVCRSTSFLKRPSGRAISAS